MKVFYNRDLELKRLREISIVSKSTSQFTYIVGPRRVGKTLLIKKILKETPNSLYFFVSRKKEKVLLEEYSEIISLKLGYIVQFESLENLWKFIFTITQKHNYTVVFDEFQNFAYVNKNMFSIIQKLWDEFKDTSKLNLIVIGSIYSAIEKIFSNKHEPLFGRADNRFYISPLNLKNLYTIYRDHNGKELFHFIELYSLFGGIPKYYDLLEQRKLFNKSVEKIYEDLFLLPGSPLREEGKDLLIEEFGKDYQTFFSILEAIAGHGSLNNQSLANLIGVPESSMSQYLQNLEHEYNIIEKQTPLPLVHQKKGRYYIKHPILNFWFRYIQADYSLVETENYQVLKQIFIDNKHSYFGYHFEEFCKKLIQQSYKTFPYKKVGKYWDKHMEIDITAIDKTNKTMLIGECKLNPKSINLELVEELNRKEALLQNKVSGYTIQKYIFTPGEYGKSIIQGIKIMDQKKIIKLLT